MFIFNKKKILSSLYPLFNMFVFRQSYIYRCVSAHTLFKVLIGKMPTTLFLPRLLWLIATAAHMFPNPWLLFSESCAFLYRYIMFGRCICEKYQSKDEKFPEPNGEGNLVSRLVFFANTPPKLTWYYLFNYTELWSVTVILAICFNRIFSFIYIFQS